MMGHKRRHLARREFPRDPVLVNPLGIDRYPALSGESWGGHAIWSVLPWLQDGNQAVRKRVEQLATDSLSDEVRNQATLLLALADGKAHAITRNPSFELGTGKASADWSYWVKPDPTTKKSVGTMARSSDRTHDGQFSLLCDGMYRGGPVNTLAPIEPGTYYALAWVYVDLPSDQELSGTCELVVTPRDGAGQQSAWGAEHQSHSAARPLDTGGHWRRDPGRDGWQTGRSSAGDSDRRRIPEGQSVLGRCCPVSPGGCE